MATDSNDISNTGGYAPFDLSKTRKFDRKKDQRILSKNFFNDAKEYFDASLFMLMTTKTKWMSVILTDISFSCELLLKALLYHYEISFQNMHGLYDLFMLLPEDTRCYISQNIKLPPPETNFHLCLKEQNDAFTVYRYMSEAKAIACNPLFLFSFAHILQFVYEQLEIDYLESHPEEKT